MKLQHTFFILFILFALFSNPAHAGNTEPRNRVERMDLAALDELMKSQGAPDIIALMAAWCGPCIEELPVLNKLYGEYKNQGFKLVGVALDLKGPSAMQPAVDRLNVNFPIYWVGEEAIEAYRIDKLPMLFVVEDGKITERIHGKRSENFLEEKIKDICNSKKMNRQQ